MTTWLDLVAAVKRAAPWRPVRVRPAHVAAVLVLLVVGHDLLMASPSSTGHDVPITAWMLVDPDDVMADGPHHDDASGRHGNGSDEAIACSVVRNACLTDPAFRPSSVAITPHPVESAGFARDEWSDGFADGHSPPTRSPRLMLALIHVLRV